MKKSVLIVGLGIVLAACSPATEQSIPSTDTSVEMEQDSMMETSNDGAMMEAESDQAQTITINADDFSYDVKEIKVKKGDKVTLSVTNTEGMHDLLIDELNVDTGMIPAGQTVEVEVPTDQAGTYEYYCSVGQHRAMGMVGTLIIEE